MSVISRDSAAGVVAIGASAGGVEALTQVASGLPRDLPYAVLAVLHMPPEAPSVLARIVDRSGLLPAESANNGAPLEPGRIYVGVPNRHLLVLDGHTMITNGPTENGYRPAINALFRSVALAYGRRAIGLLLSGVLDDGVLGLAAIRSRGGTTIAQDPDDALFCGMPQNAIRAGVVDHQVAAADVGNLLTRLAKEGFEEREMEPDHNMEVENRIAMGRRFATANESEALGPPSGYTCPDCNGGLISISEGNFRCRIGHAWTADALLSAREHEVESALGIAVRSLQEKAKLSRRLAEGADATPLVQRYTALAEEAEHAAIVLADRLTEASTGVGEQDVG